MSKNKNGGEAESSLSESFLFGSSLTESSLSESSQSESSDAEASNKPITNREKSAQLDSTGAILTKGQTGHNQASANTPLNVTEKDKNRSNSLTCAAMQSHVEVSKNKDKNSIGTDKDSITPHCQEVAPSAVESKRKKKKKKRKRKETVPATSGTENPASVRNEGESKLRSSDTCLGNPFIQELIASRISEIESGNAEPKPIEYSHKYKVIKSPSLVEKQKKTLSAGSEELNSSKGELRYYTKFKIEKDKLIPLKHGLTISPVHTPKAVGSAGNSQASSETRRLNKVEKDNVKSKSTSHTQESRNKKENTIGEVGDEFRPMQIASSEDIPKEKSLEKSVPETSGTESLSSAKYEGVQNDCSNTVFEKENRTYDSNRPVIFMNDKSTQTDPLQESPLSSRSAGNSQASSANRRVNKVEKDNVKSKSASHTRQDTQEARNKKENTTGEVSDKFRPMQIASSKEIPKKKSREKSVPETSGTESLSCAKYEGVQIDCSNTVFEKENRTYDSNRSVIFVNDKSTQTDPLQESPLSSKQYHSGNISAPNSDSEFTIEAEETEADRIFPPAESNLENVFEDIDNSKEFCSSSKDENLQSIREDFLRELKIASDSFAERFIKCFKDAN